MKKGVREFSFVSEQARNQAIKDRNDHRRDIAPKLQSRDAGDSTAPTVARKTNPQTISNECKKRKLATTGKVADAVMQLIKQVENEKPSAAQVSNIPQKTNLNILKYEVVKPIKLKKLLTKKEQPKSKANQTKPPVTPKPVQELKIKMQVESSSSSDSESESETDSWMNIHPARFNGKFSSNNSSCIDSGILIKSQVRNTCYGQVYLAYSKILKQPVVLKTYIKSALGGEEQIEHLRQVLKIHVSLKHPYILRTYKAYENPNQFLVVTEHAPGGTLFEKLKERSLSGEREMQQIFRQLAAAIYFCHRNQITHSCLRLEDIYFDKKRDVKIANFGLCRLFPRDNLRPTFCGKTSLYASPETVKGIRYYGPEVDCWALGIILYAMTYRKMPFCANNENDVVLKILTCDYRNSGRPSGVANLIRHMLIEDRHLRYTITKICSHWWVDSNCSQTCLKWAQRLAEHRKLPNDIAVGLKLKEKSEINKPIKSNPIINFTSAVKILECGQLQDVKVGDKKSKKMPVKIPTPREILRTLKFVTEAPVNIENTAKEVLTPAEPDSMQSKVTKTSDQYVSNGNVKGTFKNNQPLFQAIEQFIAKRAIFDELKNPKKKISEEQAKKSKINKIEMIPVPELTENPPRSLPSCFTPDLSETVYESKHSIPLDAKTSNKRVSFTERGTAVPVTMAATATATVTATATASVPKPQPQLKLEPKAEAKQHKKTVATPTKKVKTIHEDAIKQHCLKSELNATSRNRPYCILEGFDEHIVKLKNLADNKENSRYIFTVDDYQPTKASSSHENLKYVKRFKQLNKAKIPRASNTLAHEVNRYY